MGHTGDFVDDRSRATPLSISDRQATKPTTKSGCTCFSMQCLVSLSGLPLTWKTWKSQEFERDLLKSGNLPKKSGTLRQNSKSHGKVREFCCLKFIFSQVEDPNFEIFLREHAPRPPKWSRTHGRA